MKKLSDNVTVIIFFTAIIVFALLVIFLPKNSFSDIENRLLSGFPKVNLTTIENKKAMDGIENFISDHFPLRIFWVKTKTTAEVAIGKREINDVYISSERLMQKITDADEAVINGNINGINAFSKHFGIPSYVMLVPTAAGIYTENIPFDAPNLDQKSYIENIYNLLDETVTPIKIFDDLYLQKEDYIYYRTDHHWTARGAFFAYENAAEKMGFSPLSETDFTIENAADNFYGSLYSKVLYDGVSPDKIYIYHSNSDVKITGVSVYENLESEPIFYDSIYMRDYLTARNKYPVFLGENQPMVKINSTAGGGKLLVIKDSYANSFVPFLTEHFSEITLLDMRYINISLDEFLDMSEIDSVLFLYNTVSFNTDNNLRKFE
ncbi:MAG: hypothetical protein LBM41_06440 [Ruminococcus sp.]|jgi:hypothetical protein|nr:hypothetical protein [Ruminococcus sp.]